MRSLTGLAVTALFSFSMAFAGTSLADDDSELGAARAQMLAALGENCDAEQNADGDYFQDKAYLLKWKDTSYDPAGEDREGTLYEVFCAAGAYNFIVAYLFANKDSPASLIALPMPLFDYAYEDGDDTMTKLEREPTLKGFSAELLLVNPSFDPETMTLTSFNKWRGLGDAWSSGTWKFENGQFVLQDFTVDPTYEANLDDPSEEQLDKSYTIYQLQN
ncbi:DUF1176 domain-containing protein [Rhizobium sp. L1K21]|uniref:DUF1176 domain-containing protein n=1 Tax=Rhizobium sp. L1K21 TaxID=2954933 RepID=UPI002093F10D|nr:DUF1176 domain-containing protein [Rhizobium sp. L1K21]MCO6186342.1 DUF1176 domain-containing protein [Rhizobium sp. L1K21]